MKLPEQAKKMDSKSKEKETPTKEQSAKRKRGDGGIIKIRYKDTELINPKIERV